MAFVLGVAFGALVTAFVTDLITPLIAAIFGKQDFSKLSLTINGSRFLYGDFLNALITFVSIAAAVFFFVVRPYNALMARARGGAAGGRGRAPVSRVPERDPVGGPALRVLHR